MRKMDKMTNQEIIDNIKSKLTKDKEVDLPYLRCEFKIYQTMQPYKCS